MWLDAAMVPRLGTRGVGRWHVRETQDSSGMSKSEECWDVFLCSGVATLV